jgi:hypothetical protein
MFSFRHFDNHLIDYGKAEWIQELCGNLFGEISAGGAVGLFEGGEGGGHGLKNAGLEGEEVELALALNVNQACGFEFLDVVGEGGCGDGEGGAGLGAANGAVGGGDLLKQLKPARIGEGFEDCGAMRAGEADGFRGWWRGGRAV